MCCGSRVERISRHIFLRDIIWKAAVSAALGPTRNEKVLIPGSAKQPGDILIPYWTAGQATALDVTVINPLQSATVGHAATVPGQ